jgi:NitT/TauT family transport system substrate-binding protein
MVKHGLDTRGAIGRRTLLGCGLGLGVAGTLTGASAAVGTPVLRCLNSVNRSIGHLPLVLAQQLGFFEAEGVRIEGLQPSADEAQPPSARGNQPNPTSTGVNAGELPLLLDDFEHTLWDHARGERPVVFLALSRTPQLVLGVRQQGPSHLRGLAGRRVGVAHLGGKAHRLAQWMLFQAGVSLTQVHFVAVPGGGSLYQALQAGQVDAVCQEEPWISRMEVGGQFRVLNDTRLLRPTQALFGSTVPFDCLSAPAALLKQHRSTYQAVAHGVVHALKWMQTAAPRDLVLALPPGYFQGDRAMFLSAYAKSVQGINPQGDIPPEGPRNLWRVLGRLSGDPGLGRVDVSATFTHELALKARDKYRL